MKYCEYCCEHILHDEDAREYPEDLPDDIPWPEHDTGGMYYHGWCFESVVAEERQEIALKHGEG